MIHVGELEAADGDLIAVSVSPTPARVSSSVDGGMMPPRQKHTENKRIKTSTGMGVKPPNFLPWLPHFLLCDLSLVPALSGPQSSHQ